MEQEEGDCQGEGWEGRDSRNLWEHLIDQPFILWYLLALFTLPDFDIIVFTMTMFYVNSNEDLMQLFYDETEMGFRIDAYLLFSLTKGQKFCSA